MIKREVKNMNKIIERINTVFEPYGLKVNDIRTGAQTIRYIINLPLDTKMQGKVRRATKDIEYTLSSALGTNEYTYGHDATSLYIEVRSNEFKVTNFNSFKSALHTSKLNIVLGTDSNGDRLITNLSKAPHILIGGTTGSGKSELLHAIVCSLYEGMKYTGVELLIIDPKRAEYSPYKNCKRTMIVTDVDKATAYLNKAVDIMEERYAELESSGAKDIYHYAGTKEMLPIVIIIDELADLIQSHPEVEKPIVRIAQKARACGIHLIIATQSPRRDVITGLIKSNMPTRIALKTSSSMESRIIMDRTGAENLMGKGDMLFLGNGKFDTIRIQSAYVDEQTKAAIANENRRSDNKPTTPTTPTTPVQSSNHSPAPKKKVGFFQGIKNIIKSGGKIDYAVMHYSDML